MNSSKQRPPEGWISAFLSQLVFNPKSDIVGGPFGSNLKASEYIDHGIPIIRLQNIARNHFIKKNIKHITSLKARELERHNFTPNDLVITKLGQPLGKACLIPNDFGPGIIVADVVRFSTSQTICYPSYVMYSINSHGPINQLSKQVKGTTRPRVNLNSIRNLTIPLAPLEEQKRIVAVVENLSTRISNTKELLETAAKTIRRFRKSVLNSACTGKLTEDWREKQPDSKCTRTSSENNLLTEIKGFNFEIPKNWTIVSAEYVCNKITDGVHKTPKRRKEGRMLLSAKNIRSGYIDYENHDLISEDDFNRCLLRCNPEPGDVLIVSVGATIGRCAIVEKDTKFAIVRSVGLFKPNDLIRGKLLMYILQSPLLQKVIESVSQGTAQLCLYINKMKKLPIPLPPLEEQQETVRRVDRLFEFADNVEERIIEARERVVKLTQSILSKAFRGELVPTEAELARRQGQTYETAVQLLERIRLEGEKKRTLEIKVSEKIKVRGKVMGTVRGPKKQPVRHPLLDVIRKNPKGLTPENLLRMAHYTIEEIDDFYCDLSNIMQEIEEIKPSGSQAKKWPTKTNVLIKPRRCKS